MKVLFLDIDGVLNHNTTKERIRGRGELIDGFMGIDQVLLKRFLDWLDGKDVETVLSSTWRTDDGTIEELKDNGITWIGMTPRLGRRGYEIAHWLNRNPVDRFSIVDDVDQFFPDQRPYLVLTDPDFGITDENLNQLETILGL